jgi:hypothetical protein
MYLQSNSTSKQFDRAALKPATNECYKSWRHTGKCQPSLLRVDSVVDALQVARQHDPPAIDLSLIVRQSSTLNSLSRASVRTGHTTDIERLTVSALLSTRVFLGCRPVGSGRFPPSALRTGASQPRPPAAPGRAQSRDSRCLPTAEAATETGLQI